VSYVLLTDDLTPSGNSKINLIDDRRRVWGILSENSVNKNNLKFGFGFILNKSCSNSFNQLGAKWTFFKITQEPFLAALSIDLYASSNPSADPMATSSYDLFNYFARSYILEEGSNPGADENKIAEF
jgi:hypothetical protein